MIEIKIKLYRLEELPETSRRRAIEDHRSFMLNTLTPDFIDGVTDWNDPEKMEMYHNEYQYIEDHDEPVIENIDINDYFFFYDGDLANVVHYTGGPLAGQTWATIRGERYLIEGAAG